MPHNSSTRKRLRQDKARHVKNRSVKREIGTRTKTLLAAVEQGDTEKSQQLLRVVVSRIDKAAKRNILHRNKAARMQSKLAKIVATAAKS